ncbi:hypothetical protein CBR_g32134 [Chara braunii]|uniref:Ubiquitin-like protease family profile domain-containing protein n=1 Tax=Chara braunii TaxID=69332 RepID=A0A388JMT1_CHABU|nr:hypothetical protein CBR_g32134 [Chara braunii]|eukprot:GBG59116.1 hypothetical protein CBR_g32134 [Chara braunii]
MRKKKVRNAKPGVANIDNEKLGRKEVLYNAPMDPATRKGKKEKDEGDCFVQVPEPDTHCWKAMESLTANEKCRVLKKVLACEVVWVQAGSSALAKLGKLGVQEMVHLVKCDHVLVRFWNYYQFKHEKRPDADWIQRYPFLKTRSAIFKQFESRGLDAELWDGSRKYVTDSSLFKECPPYMGCNDDHSIEATEKLAGHRKLSIDWRNKVLSVFTDSRLKSRETALAEGIVHIKWKDTGDVTSIAPFGNEPLEANITSAELKEAVAATKSHTFFLDLCKPVDLKLWKPQAFDTLDSQLQTWCPSHWTLVVFVLWQQNLSFLASMNHLSFVKLLKGTWTSPARQGIVYGNMEHNPTQFVNLLEFVSKKGEGVAFLGKPHGGTVWELLKVGRHVVVMEGNSDLLQFTMQVVKSEVNSGAHNCEFVVVKETRDRLWNNKTDMWFKGSGEMAGLHAREGGGVMEEGKEREEGEEGEEGEEEGYEGEEEEEEGEEGEKGGETELSELFEGKEGAKGDIDIGDDERTMSGGITDDVGKVLTIDDLVEALDRRKRLQSNVPKVNTVHWIGERVSECLKLVEQAPVGLLDAVKFQRILNPAPSGQMVPYVGPQASMPPPSYPAVQAEPVAPPPSPTPSSQGNVARGGNQGHNNQGNGGSGSGRGRGRNGASQGGHWDNQGYQGQGSQGNQGGQGYGRPRFDWRTAICQHCDKQGHTIRFCNIRQRDEKSGMIYSNMDGDIYDQYGEYMDRKVPGGVRAEAKRRIVARQAPPATFRLWQERNGPPIRVDEVENDGEVTQRLQARTIKEEPIVVGSDREGENEKVKSASVLPGKMEDVWEKMGRYQGKLVDICEKVRKWRAKIPKVFLYDSGPESVPGRQGDHGVATVGSGPRSGMTFRPPTAQGRMA